MVTLHVLPDDESHPLQLTTIEPKAGTAVRVTTVSAS